MVFQYLSNISNNPHNYFLKAIISFWLNFANNYHDSKYINFILVIAYVFFCNKLKRHHFKQDFYSSWNLDHGANEKIGTSDSPADYCTSLLISMHGSYQRDDTLEYPLCLRYDTPITCFARLKLLISRYLCDSIDCGSWVGPWTRERTNGLNGISHELLPLPCGGIASISSEDAVECIRIRGIPLI